MEFSSGYSMGMDRGYVADTEKEGTQDVGDIGIVPIKEIGFSVPLGIAAPNVQGVAAKIRTGARIIELQFPGAGRSQRGAQTPELYGELQRTALEELSRANQVDFTTHASFSVMGLAGMDQQGNFSKQNRDFAIDEIKRAVEFAADVARGGNVTIHTGEFQRPISEESWAIDPATGRHIFKNYEDEPERAVIRVVDERSGQIAAQVRKNQNVARPVWLQARAGEIYYDEEGNEMTSREGETVFIDYDRKKVRSMEERVPQFDPETGRFKVEYWDWNRFIREAKDRTQEAREFWQMNKNNPDAWRNSIYWQFREAKSEDDVTVDPEEAYVQATLETNAANAKGWALYYGGDFKSELDQVRKLRKARELWVKIEAGVPEDEAWKLKKQINELTAEAIGLIPPEHKKPTEIIDKELRNLNRRMEQAREASTSQEQQASDAYETMRHIVSQKKYALKEAYSAYGEAGMYAMMHSEKLKKQGKLKKEPIFVALEHIFPESYGGHPDELMDLVEGGRRAMIDKLKQQGHSAEEAKKAAETHIKGHLDTGHINLWRKYWVWDEKISPEENERKYNQWLLTKVEQMAAKNMIGSVHLTDNYGYHDEHLSPGQGNSPVVEMVKILKSHGFKGALIVEPGADATTDLSDFHGLMKTWRLFGSPIYGTGFGSGASPGRNRAWGEVQYSYFGQTEPPYFVFGRYSPSEDWTLWSGVPME